MDASVASSESTSRCAIQHKAYARVGLLGNPSDVYFGRTISFTLANFWASVRLQPSDELVISPHPTHDLVHFHSLDHLVLLSLTLSLSLSVCVSLCFSLSLYCFLIMVMWVYLKDGRGKCKLGAEAPRATAATEVDHLLQWQDLRF